MITKYQFEEAMEELESLSELLTPSAADRLSDQMQTITRFVEQLEKEADDLSKELEVVEGNSRRPRRRFDDDEE